MSNPPKYHFAMNLKRLREYRGMTVAQVCITLNVSAISWAIWETGPSLPKEPMLVRVCNMLGYYDIYGMISGSIDFKTVLKKD